MFSPKTATRLFTGIVLLALLCVSPLAGFEAHGNSPALTLRKQDIKKGESIVTQLRRLEQFAAASSDSRNYSALVEKLYPGLFVKVSELRDSDLKTDLTTAVFLYEQVFHEPNKHRLNCEDELRSVYARICVENHGGTVLELLRAKARLHTRWAETMIKFHQGSNDDATIAALEEIQRERRNDLLLAEKAVEALKTLEKQVYPYSSLSQFEEHGALAKTPFERLSVDASAALQSVDRVLHSLPRSPLFYPLYNARNAYADGFLWWQKTYRLKKLVVDVNSLHEPEELKLIGLDPKMVNYTVVINWRNAVKRTRQAEKIIEAAKN
jgi:hypothetical protein